jgi:hypothetical protein
MKLPKAIGICGLATSGKDTLCNLLIDEFKRKGVKAKRFALADQLKVKIWSFLLTNFEVDIFNPTPEQKELVRPLLVEFGRAHRIQSEGKYWTSIVEDCINQEPEVIPIITDIRYDEYVKDEVWWLQKHLKGKLVHVTRFLENGQPLTAPNKDEAENDPRLLEKADFRIRWNTSMAEARKEASNFFKTLING